MPRFTLPSLALLITCLLAASPARAYDEDTHFYGTYAMARHAGIRHEVAVKIALSAQWMDESFISDPTSMIFMPLTGVKKRRILHFPSSRINKNATEAEKAIFGLNDLGEFGNVVTEKLAAMANVSKEELDKLNIISVTQEDDGMASQMLFEGINEGNLMKAATGLHTLEDSFAHAGTPAGAGHAMWWHWPDRPYGSIEKYKRMVHSVMGALVGIRTLLPREALDCNLATAGGRPNCEADQEALADSYIPLIIPVISHDMLRDPEYVTTALHEFYSRAAEEKYVVVPEEEFFKRVNAIEIVDGKTNAYDAVSQLFVNDLSGIAAGKPSMFNMNKILADMGSVNSGESVDVLKVVDRYGINGIKDWKDDARKRFARVVALEQLAWHVPLDQSDSHRMEFEDDKDEVRKFEVEKRVANMQAFILRNYGTDVVFVNNNTTDDVGFYHEIHQDPSAAPDFMAKPGFKPRKGAVYATFSLAEKNAFDRMILSYLFPKMTHDQVFGLLEAFAKLKKMLMERSEYFAERKKIEDSAANWISKKYQLVKLDIRYHRYKEVSAAKVKFVDVLLKEVQPHVKALMLDLVSSHLHPDENVFAYRRDENFQEYLKAHKIEKFLGEKDTWKQRELLEHPNAPASFFSGLFQ